MRRPAIWASGYSRNITRNASPEDLEHLAKLGSTVLATALWTAVTWAVAFTAYAGTETPAQFAAVGALAAFGGFGFVTLYDRSMLYAMDARLDQRIPVMWLISRLAIVLALGVFTSERLMPVFLKAELEQQALVDREMSDAARQQALDRRFQTPQLATKTEAAEAEVRRLEREASQIPEPIQRALDEARNCSIGLNRERGRLRIAGVARREARRRLAGRARVCRALDYQAREGLSDFRETMRARVAEARGQAGNYRVRYSDAAAAVDQRVNEARAIEARSLTPDSSQVFWRMITTSPMALLKAAVLLIIMVTIELLPFIIKGFAGRTGLGARLAAARAIGWIDAETQLDCHRNEARIAIDSSDAVAAAMAAALEGREVQEFLQTHCVEQARALAPFEVALRTLRTAESKKREVDSIAARAPELAAMAHALLARAIREAGEALRPAAI